MLNLKKYRILQLKNIEKTGFFLKLLLILSIKKEKKNIKLVNIY